MQPVDSPDFLDLPCHICGVMCPTDPDAAWRVACKQHCCHDYQYDDERHDWFCLRCDQAQPVDFDDLFESYCDMGEEYHAIHPEL